MNVVARFASAIGEDGTVTCVGGRTQWDVGGSLLGEVREVSAPAGVVAHEPGEMIVRVRAGTTLAELDEATRAAGQYVALEAAEPERATVGGVLACGRGGLRRLGWGPPRDAVLEMTAVTAAGTVIRSGAPLVKNVTGFDLCRLLVGSVGTLALTAEVVLRCQPRPEVERWWVGEEGSVTDPFALRASLYRPLAVLWDGTRTWVGLSGHRADVDGQAKTVLGAAGSFRPVPAPPVPPAGGRRSLTPAAVRGIPGRLGGAGWLAEIGVGVVHCTAESAAHLPVPAPQPGVVELHRRLKARFDPDGRLSPGRSPLAAAPAVAG
jgi:FAD/FMN-containing dehydrogenase